jgi:hypothetical protein
MAAAMTDTYRIAFARKIADQKAKDMRRILQHGATPDDLGFEGMTADDLVRSEWRCWFADTLQELDNGCAREEILRMAWRAGISFRSRLPR